MVKPIESREFQKIERCVPVNIPYCREIGRPVDTVHAWFSVQAVRESKKKKKKNSTKKTRTQQFAQ